jgi:dTDP-4-dehydrorhamnose 3,5-epimerase
MRFHPLSIAGAFRIEIEPVRDERGFFARTFAAEEFRAMGLVSDFVERSLSLNKLRGTLRGMHWQAAPDEETKLVRCTHGAIFDVLVDLRKGSPTFAKWHGLELSASNHVAAYIPQGCAHGFQTLVDETEVAYEISRAYVAEGARGVRFDDPTLAIAWPIANPTISARDRALPMLAAAGVVAS